MNELETKIQTFLQSTFGISIAQSNTSLVSDGLIDSMQVLDVAMFLEEEAGVSLDETDLVVENFDTVAAMAQLVNSKG